MPADRPERDDEVVVIENWLEWIQKPTEPDYTIRFVIRNRKTGETWDSGFISGAISVVYSEEQRLILVLQQSYGIYRKGETQDMVFSYLVDINKRIVKRFMHPRIPSGGGFFVNTDSVWIAMHAWQNKETISGLYLYHYDEMELYAE